MRCFEGNISNIICVAVKGRSGFCGHRAVGDNDGEEGKCFSPL
jgi:hypothetical protein